MSKQCIICGVAFERRRKPSGAYDETASNYRRRVTCSSACTRERQSRLQRARRDQQRVEQVEALPKTRTCEACGRQFPRRQRAGRFTETPARYLARKYCGLACSGRATYQPTAAPARPRKPGALPDHVRYSPKPAPVPIAERQPTAPMSRELRHALADAIECHPELYQALTNPEYGIAAAASLATQGGDYGIGTRKPGQLLQDGSEA